MTTDQRKNLWAAARAHADAKTDDDRLTELVKLEKVVEAIVADALKRHRDALAREDAMGGWQ